MNIWQQQCEEVAENNRLNPHKKPVILPEAPLPITKKLSQHDWSIVMRYMEVLKPIMLASKKLEGSPKEGKNGCLWEVLPIFESLLNFFERKADEFEQYQDQLDDEFGAFNHLRISCQLGWQKIEEYYKKLDNTPIVYAAFVLHPRFRFEKLHKLWAGKEDWIEKVEAQIQTLWAWYKKLDLGITSSKPVSLSQQQSREDFLNSFL
jgi:hypothetical protein